MKDEMKQTEKVNILIVGAGTASSVYATLLAEAGKIIMVLRLSYYNYRYKVVVIIK